MTERYVYRLCLGCGRVFGRLCQRPKGCLPYCATCMVARRRAQKRAWYERHRQ
jgi:hypothetical protein